MTTTIQRIDVGISVNEGEAHISFTVKEITHCAYAFSVPIKQASSALACLASVHGGQTQSNLMIGTSSNRKEYAMEIYNVDCSLRDVHMMIDEWTKTNHITLAKYKTARENKALNPPR